MTPPLQSSRRSSRKGTPCTLNQMEKGKLNLKQNPMCHGTSRTATPGQSGRPFTTQASSSTSTGATIPRGKDLLQRLMDKGLIPLAALDVIRGWMLLEMATASDDERRIVRAATQNRLSYSAIRSALLSMYEEKAHRIPMDLGKGLKGKSRVYFHEGLYGGENEPEDTPDYDAALFNEGSEDPDQEWWYDPMGQDAWWQLVGAEDEGDTEQIPSDMPEHDEEYAHLIREQEDAEKSMNELYALAAENERNLVEARRAVQAATRDRGWGQPPQQKQSKFTSSYPGKGKRKGPALHGKGKVNYQEDLAWMKGGKNSKGYPKGKGYPNYVNGPKGYKGSPFPSSTSTSSMSRSFGKDAHYMHMNHMSHHDMYAGECEQEDRLAEGESIIDTGATASAGGQWAVQQLCTAVMRAAPDATMEVFASDRPWFRFGNGKWGQALYRVQLQRGDVVVSIFALPSPGVPVLTGMRDLMQWSTILNCSNGRGIIHGNMCTLRMTRKKHMVLNYLKDVFPPCSSSPTSTPVSLDSRNKQTVPAVNGTDDVRPNALPRHRIKISPTGQIRTGGQQGCANFSHFAEEHDLWTFSLNEVEPHLHDTCFMNMDTVSDEQKSVFAKHFNISPREMDHLLSSPAVANQESDQPDSKCFALHGILGAESRAEAVDPRSTPRRTSMLKRPVKCRESEDQGQEQGLQDSVRRDSNLWPRSEGSQDVIRDVALLQPACTSSGEQPLRPMERMQCVRGTDVIYPSQGCSRTNHPCGSSPECDGGLASPALGGVPVPRVDVAHREGYDHDCGERKDLGEERSECQGQDKGQGESSHSAPWGSSRNRGLRLKQRVRFQHGDCRGECEEGEGRQGGQGEVIGREGQSTVEAMDLDHVHNEHPDILRDECVRNLRQDESRMLLHAANEFMVESTITNLQDFDPLCTVWEVCCRPDSSLTQECIRQGLHAHRKSIENGYDLERASTVKLLKEDMKVEKPGRNWFSLRCTEWSNIQNINQRTPQQVEMLKRRRWRSRKMTRNALEVIEEGLNTIEGYKFYWEWPKTAYADGTRKK